MHVKEMNPLALLWSSLTTELIQLMRALELLPKPLYKTVNEYSYREHLQYGSFLWAYQFAPLSM